jgi:hypothetical protein
MSASGSWRDIGTLHYPRALMLMAFGALLGLGLAAYGLFTAKGTSTLVVPPEDVALVNQQPVMRSDYLVLLQTLYNVDYAHATPAQRHAALDDMIREELFVQRGGELDVASADPTVRSAMVSAVEQQAATDAMTDLPSNDKLLQYYNDHKARYSSDGYMDVRELLLPAGTAPATVAAARQVSADQAIAKFSARDTGRVSGDEFYFAAPIHLGPLLAKKAEALANGAVSEPVVMPDGIHLLYMSKNVPPVPMDFSKARERVLADYRQDAVQKMLVNQQKFLRERADILVADDLK